MKKNPHIALCIILDIIGSLNWLIPFGEWVDFVWAPISAVVFYFMFGGRGGRIGAVVSFLEELLPFTDVIPTFTIAYLIKKYMYRENK